MDLHELATNATLDHWPPHLGVRTDAEKIAYLAQVLKSNVTDKDAEIENLESRLEAMEEEAIDLQNTIDSRDDQIEKLKDQITELGGKVE